MAESNGRYGPRQYVSDKDRESYRKEAEAEYRNFNLDQLEKALDKSTNPGWATRGIKGVWEFLKGVANFIKVITLSVFLGRQETAKRINQGNLESEKQKQQNEAKKEIREEVLKEKIEQLNKGEQIKDVQTKSKEETQKIYKEQVNNLTDLYKEGLEKHLQEKLGEMSPFGNIKVETEKDKDGKSYISIEFYNAATKNGDQISAVFNSSVYLDENFNASPREQVTGGINVKNLTAEEIEQLKNAIEEYTQDIYDPTKEPKKEEIKDDPEQGTEDKKKDEKDVEKENENKDKKEIEPDLTKDYSIEKTQFDMQLEHMSDSYQQGLTQFLGKQMGIEQENIGVINYKDQKGKDWIQINVITPNSAAFTVCVDREGKWRVPSNYNKDKNLDKDIQAFAGEIRKATMYYTGKIYDQIKDPEYNHVTRDVQAKDGKIEKEPLIGETFNKIPTGISISEKRVEEILNKLFEKGGISKNQIFAVPITFERKGDVINVKSYGNDKEPLVVHKEDITGMSKIIAEKMQGQIENTYESFEKNEHKLQAYMEAADKAFEKNFEETLKKEMIKNIEKQIETAKQEKENEKDHSNEQKPEQQLDTADTKKEQENTNDVPDKKEEVPDKSDNMQDNSDPEKTPDGSNETPKNNESEKLEQQEQQNEEQEEETEYEGMDETDTPISQLNEDGEIQSEFDRYSEEAAKVDRNSRTDFINPDYENPQPVQDDQERG